MRRTLVIAVKLTVRVDPAAFEKAKNYRVRMTSQEIRDAVKADAIEAVRDSLSRVPGVDVSFGIIR